MSESIGDIAAGSYERRLVAVLTLAGGIAALDAQAVFYIMPFIARDLHLTNAQIGLIGAAVLVGWSLAALVCAQISDRMGRRKPFLTGAFVAFGLLSSLSALATSFAQLLAARFLIGLAEGPVLPIQHKLVMAASPPERRGLNMSLVHNLGAQLIGTLTAPIVLVWLASVAGWRSAFMIAAIPGLLIALVIAIVVREPPRHGETDGFPVPAASPRKVWGNRNVRLCVLIGTCAVAWYFLLLTFLPLWLTREAGYSSGNMSLMVAVIGAAGAIGAIIVGRAADRIGRRRSMIAFCAVGALAPMGALFLGAAPLLLGIALFAGGLMIGTFSIFMGTLPQEAVGPENGASATALVMCIAQLAGGVLGPAIGGLAADRIAPSAPLFLAGLLAVAAALLSLLLREPQRGAA